VVAGEAEREEDGGRGVMPTNGWIAPTRASAAVQGDRPKTLMHEGAVQITVHGLQ